MQQPARIDLAGDRWVAFVRTLPIVNADLTGAVLSLQVRLYPDAPGVPLVDLTTVTSGASQGVRVAAAVTGTIAAHVAAGRLDEIPGTINPLTGAAYAGSDVVTVSVIGIRINETAMEALPYPAERGGDTELAWDIHITPAGQLKDKYAGGAFTVRAGATQ